MIIETDQLMLTSELATLLKCCYLDDSFKNFYKAEGGRNVMLKVQQFKSKEVTLVL